MEADYTIRLQDRFSSPLSKMEKRMGRFENRIDRLQAGATKFAGTLGLAFGAQEVVRGIFNLGKTILSLGADMEQTRVKFETMLGSAEKSKFMIEALQDFAAATPFQTTDLTRNAELLLNFGATAESIIPTLRMLGDVSGGNKERFNALSLAFAQVQSQGRLMGQDLLQMVNAGFNPLQIISEKTGKSMKTLKEEMSKGLVSFDMVADAFKAATSEGGRFFQLMEKQSKTFAGRVSTLRDNVERIGISLGEKALPFMGRLVDITARFVQIIPLVDFGPLIGNFGELAAIGGEIIDTFSQMSELFGVSVKGASALQKIIQYFGFTLRVSLTPIRIFLKATNLMLKVVTELGTAIKALFNFDFDGAKAAAGRAGSAFKNAFNREKEGWERIFNPQNKAEKDKAVNPFATGTTTAGAAAGASKKLGREAGVEKIASGTRNVTLNISKLVGEIKFEKSIERSEAQMMDIVKRVLLTAVNDVNIVAQ